MKYSPVILFDGVCNLCNGAVNFVIRSDKKSRIKFAALQSEPGRNLLRQYNLEVNQLSTFVLIENGKVYTESTAALKLCKYLTALWPLLYGFIIVPKFIRDPVYKWISANRYNWFGKREQCMVPTTDVKERFLQ